MKSKRLAMLHRFFILVFAIFSLNAFGKKRQISSNTYYTCVIEKIFPADNEGFKKEFTFPVPAKKAETYQTKIKTRAISFDFTFNFNGKISYRISDHTEIQKKPIVIKEEYQIENYTAKEIIQFEWTAPKIKDPSKIYTKVEYKISCNL